VTAAGHTFSKGANGIVVDGTSTFAATNAVGQTASVITVDGHTFSADSNGDIVVDGTSTVQIAPSGAGVSGAGAATASTGGINTLTPSLAASQSGSRSSGSAPAQQTTNAAGRADIGATAGLVIFFVGVLALL